MYYWNQETIDYFRELKEQSKLTELKREVWYFVYHNCDVEEDETFEDLAKDLFRQIFKN